MSYDSLIEWTKKYQAESLRRLEENPVRRISDDAFNLVTGERAENYGAPVASHRKIGIVWGAMLGGEPLSARTVALMMAALKIVREGGPGSNRDNLVDACGYLLIADWADEEEA